VGCFSRGDALQEKASPLLCLYSNLPADLIGTITKIKVFLQSERSSEFLSDDLFNKKTKKRKIHQKDLQKIEK